MRNSTIACLFLLAAVPALAGEIDVSWDPEADFGSYKTYAWAETKEPLSPQGKAWFIGEVDRLLASKQLRRVEGEADFYIHILGYSTTRGGSTGGYHHSVKWDVGILWEDTRVSTAGTVLIDIVEHKSNFVVWRGLATEAMLGADMRKLQKKIQKMVRKLFKDFPPQS